MVMVQQAEKVTVSEPRAVAEMERVAVFPGVPEEVPLVEGQGVAVEEGHHVTVPEVEGVTVMEKVVEGVAVCDRVALCVGVFTRPQEGVLVGEGTKLCDPPTWLTLPALEAEVVGVEEMVAANCGEGVEEGLPVLDWVTDMVRVTAGERDWLGQGVLEEEVRGDGELVGEPEEERDTRLFVRVGLLEWEGVSRGEGEGVLDRVVDTVLVPSLLVADTEAEVVLDWVRVWVGLLVGETEEEAV